MEAFILIIIVAAAVGAVLWNHREADAAVRGSQFNVAASPPDVVRAIEGSYCSGVRASAKSIVSRIQVTPMDSTTFRTETRIGDVGTITVEPGNKGESTVSASVHELYVGSHPMTHWRGYFYGFVAGMAHRLNVLLKIAPNATKMRRFQDGLERRVTKQLRRMQRGESFEER